MDVYEQYSNTNYSKRYTLPSCECGHNNEIVKNMATNTTTNHGKDIKNGKKRDRTFSQMIPIKIIDLDNNKNKSNNSLDLSKNAYHHTYDQSSPLHRQNNLSHLSALETFESFVQRIINHEKTGVIAAAAASTNIPRASSQLFLSEIPTILNNSIGQRDTNAALQQIASNQSFRDTGDSKLCFHQTNHFKTYTLNGRVNLADHENIMLNGEEQNGICQTSNSTTKEEGSTKFGHSKNVSGNSYKSHNCTISPNVENYYSDKNNSGFKVIRTTTTRDDNDTLKKKISTTSSSVISSGSSNSSYTQKKHNSRINGFDSTRNLADRRIPVERNIPIETQIQIRSNQGDIGNKGPYDTPIITSTEQSRRYSSASSTVQSTLTSSQATKSVQVDIQIPPTTACHDRRVEVESQKNDDFKMSTTTADNNNNNYEPGTCLILKTHQQENRLGTTIAANKALNESNHSTYFEWIKDGQVLTNDVRKNSNRIKIENFAEYSVLIIQNLESIDSGTYECFRYSVPLVEKNDTIISPSRAISYKMWNIHVASRSSNDRDKTMGQMHSKNGKSNKLVKEIPLIIVDEREQLANKQQSVEPCVLRQSKRIKVSFEGKSQNYTIEWTHNLEKLVSGDKTTVEVKDKYTAVFIDSLDTCHFGIYTCKVTNEFGSNYKSTLLTTTRDSDDDTAAEKEISGNGDTTVTKSNNSSTKSDIIGMHGRNGKIAPKILGQEKEEVVRPCFIKHFTEPENEWIHVTEGVPLHLEAKIELIPLNNNTHLNGGIDIVKSPNNICKYRSKYEIEWFKDGKIIPKGEIGKYFQVLNYMGILVVECNALTCHISGTYKCRVWNQWGEDSSTFILNCCENLSDEPEKTNTKTSSTTIKTKSSNKATNEYNHNNHKTLTKLEFQSTRKQNPDQISVVQEPPTAPRISYVSTSSLSLEEPALAEKLSFEKGGNHYSNLLRRDLNQGRFSEKSVNCYRGKNPTFENFFKINNSSSLSESSTTSGFGLNNTNNNLMNLEKVREVDIVQNVGGVGGTPQQQQLHSGGAVRRKKKYYSNGGGAASASTTEHHNSRSYYSDHKQNQHQLRQYQERSYSGPYGPILVGTGQDNRTSRTTRGSSTGPNRGPPYTNGVYKRRGGGGGGGFERNSNGTFGPASSVEEYYSFKTEKIYDDHSRRSNNISSNNNGVGNIPFRDQTNIIPANTTEKFETSYRYNVPEEGYYYRDGGIDDNRYHQHGRGGRDHSMNNRTTSSSKNYNYDSSFYESESRSGGGGHHARSIQMIESPLVQTTPRHQHHYGSGRHSSAGGALDRAADLDEHFHEEQIIVRPGGKLPAPPPPAPVPEPVILQLAQPESGKKTTTTETREEFYTSCGGTEPSYFREIKPVQQEAQTTTTTRTTEFDEIEMERLAYDSGEEYEQRRRPMLDDKEVQASLTTSVTKPKYSKPTFTSRFEDTLYYRDGDRIKLEANLLPLGDKSLHVEWLKNGEPLRLNSRTTTFHENGRVGLEIYPADLSDEAIYTCQAISDNGYAAITTRLKHIPERVPVYRYEKRKTPELAREPEPPQPEGFPPMLTPGDTSIKTPRPPRQRPCFKSDLKPIDLDEGQGIHLEAKLEPLDDDNLKVDWYKDEEPLIETPKTKAGQDKGKVFLDMDDMKPKDSGVYTCKASNDFGEAIIKAPITVHPRVPKPPEQEPVPVTDYWWKDKYPPLKKTPTAPAEISPIVIHKKKRLPPLPPPEEPLDLEFIKAQGRENRKYGTEVDLPPRFITDISDLQANEWDKIRFEARLEPANDKTTQIFWYHDGKILNASSRIKTLFDYGVVILEIADITTIDAGLYECIATNNFGSDSTRAILTVREDDERIIHQTGLSSQRSSVARVKDIEETVERTIVELYPSPASFPLPGQGQTSFSTQQQHQKHFTTDEIEQQKFYKREQEEYLVDRSTSGLATGKRPIFMTELVDIRAKKHETIRIEAKVEPSIREDSTLQVGWYKNGKLMFIEEGGRIRTYNTDTGLIVLEINDTQTSDSGEYVCVIRNVSGQCLSKCKIVCRDDHYGEPPHFVNRYLRLDNLNEGDTAHVEFKLEPSDDQNMQVEWFFNGHSLKKSYRLKTVYDFGYAILDISPVTPEDSGVYECKATNLYGSKTAVAVIDVKCPRNKMVQNLGYVVVDAPKILNFKGIHAQPNTFTEICKEQVETSKLFEETEKVVVHEPQPSAPRIFKPLRDSIVTQGQQASFQCTVFGYPAPTVQWFKNDKPIQVTTQNPLQPPYISGTGIESKDLPGHYVHTLKLAECFLEDEGMYTCQLSNAAGSIRTSATLKVQQLRPDIEGPSFIRSLDSTRIAEGKSVIFKCTLTGKPTPVVTWFKDGQALLSSDKYQLSYAGTFCKLTVTNCQESDSGTYVCKAQNIAGTAECSAALLVERKDLPVIIVKTDVDTLVTTSVTTFKNDFDCDEATVSSSDAMNVNLVQGLINPADSTKLSCEGIIRDGHHIGSATVEREGSTRLEDLTERNITTQKVTNVIKATESKKEY